MKRVFDARGCSRGRHEKKKRLLMSFTSVKPTAPDRNNATKPVMKPCVRGRPSARERRERAIAATLYETHTAEESQSSAVDEPMLLFPLSLYLSLSISLSKPLSSSPHSKDNDAMIVKLN
jgi:hypothetical protein